jgi:hypothetical protein
MDIVRLPAEWRQQADRQPRISSNDVDIRATLRQCADDLELAYHQHAHDGAFEPGCRFCDWEREHNDNYPEPSRRGR